MISPEVLQSKDNSSQPFEDGFEIIAFLEQNYNMILNDEFKMLDKCHI